MSLIHQALQKVEEEKEEGLVAPSLEKLREEIQFSAPPKVFLREKLTHTLRRPRGKLWGLGALLFVGVVIGGSVFSLSKENFTTGPKTGSVPSLGENRPLRVGRARGPKDFRFTGVTFDGGEWIAVVNNQLVRVGERVSGAEVRLIQDREVLLDLDGDIIQLKLR